MIHTVNVIECTDSNRFEVAGLTSFPETVDGNIAALKLFKALIGENKDAEDVAKYMDQWESDGYCEVGEGFIALVHSK